MMPTRRFRLLRLRIFRALGILWAITMVPGAVDGGDASVEIRNRLGSPPVVRGEFEQRRSIRDLAHPLVSRGQFVFARARGVIWHTRTPFSQTVRLTREGITQERGGKVLLDLSAKRDPAIQAISEVLLSLFSGDFRQLGDHFHVAEAWRDGTWRVELTPISITMSRAFRTIRLEGADHIRRVELVDAHGDRTETRFFDVRIGDELSDAEAQQLR